VDSATEDLIKRAAADLAGARHALALTGAGMSTESGIRDFRGPDGIWTRDPEAEKRAFEAYAMFSRDPRAFWEDTLKNPPAWISHIETTQPNPGHFALQALEQMGVLGWTITQNIDGLHEKAGTQNLLEYHGSLFKLRCPVCSVRYRREDYDLLHLLETGSLPPSCKSCGAAVKPDVVYFGEPIPTDVAEQSMIEAVRADVVLVCGTSATVYPFANLPRLAGRALERAAGGVVFADMGGPGATVIEVNFEPTPLTEEGVSTYFIQGKTGEILPRIADAVKKELS
jgi:NAD-dependent deacetylase